MKNKLNTTMLAIPYIRGFYLNEAKSKNLISNYEKMAADITDKINAANGGMFTRNIETRSYYYKKILKKNSPIFDQLLVLGIGLDTKFDELEIFKDKSIFAIDLEKKNIEKIYEKAQLTTHAKIIQGDLSCLDETILHELVQSGLDVTKRTFIIWEGGTFYLESSLVFLNLLFLKRHINITGMTADFLNEDVFNNNNHPLKDTISTVLAILEKSGNEWRGFFTKDQLQQFLIDDMKLPNVKLKYHGEIESELYDQTMVIHDLIFFVESHI